MSGVTADNLRDALSALADALDPVINALPPGDPDRLAAQNAQTALRNAASDIDAINIEATLNDNASLADLKTITTRINATATNIDGSEASVTKAANVATKAVNLATALGGGGGIPAAITGLLNVV